MPKLFMFIIVLLFMICVFSLVKKKILEVEYSVSWILISMVLLLFSMFEPILLMFAKLIENLGFLLMIIITLIFSLVFIAINLSISISRLKNSIKELTQDVGIMKFEEEQKKWEEID